MVTVKKKKVNVGLDCCIYLCFPTSYEEEDKVGGKQCFTKQKRIFFFFTVKAQRQVRRFHGKQEKATESESSFRNCLDSAQKTALEILLAFFSY